MKGDVQVVGCEPSHPVYEWENMEGSYAWIVIKALSPHSLLLISPPPPQVLF